GFGKHGPLHNPFAFGYFNPVKHVGFLGSALTGGCVIYQGGLLPERFNDACIYPNLRANAMRVSRLEPSGSTFTTNYQEDFAVSSDIWFRPVDCTVGPDGALYAADWCDENISHTSPKDRSQWYPPSRGDGRIWRFVPHGANPRPMAPLGLAERTSQELIGLLTHQNAWYSREARRILGERRDPAAIEPLMQMLREKSPENEHAALEALWAIYVSGGFSEALAAELLDHPSPAVRDWTVRLVGDEQRAPPSLQAKFVELASGETDPSVRSRLACTAKRLPGPQALPIVEQMLRRDADAADPHLPLLLWWAVEGKAIADRPQVLAMLKENGFWRRPLVRGTIVERLVRRYAGENSPAGWTACCEMLNVAPDAATRNALLGAIDVQLAGGGDQQPPVELSEFVAAALDEEPLAAAALRLGLRLQIAAALPKALAVIGDRRATEADRIGLLETLGATGHPGCIDELLPLVSGEESPGVQIAALSALQRYESTSIAEELLARYPRLAPAVKSRVRALLVSRPAWARALVGAVRQKRVAADEVALDQVRQMLAHPQVELAREIESIWGKIAPATSREKQGKIRAVEQILAKGKGDAANGKRLMMKHCGTCHQLFGEGNRVGPELTSADRKNMAILLPNIIDPSAVIRPEFVAYAAQTEDGRLINGLLAASTDDAVTLLDAQNARITLKRNELEAFKPMPISLMPERILDPLADQDLRDLFAYLQSQAP
ncbi:MAG TPA: HEAT repeat domain-containing protein, partial [Pirellulales bacterium]|nr:HEAT repeat domain-containing protein [Pirellulales bacterium]